MMSVTKTRPDHDLRTPEGIAEAEADLDRFAQRAEHFASASLLPWGLLIGRYRSIIAKAKIALTKPKPRSAR